MNAYQDQIKFWPSSEKPRERLFQEGGHVLSDAELLAILLRSGVKGMNVVALSKNLIAKFSSLRGLFSCPAEELQNISGLGPAKTATLLAVREIIGRYLREEIAGCHVIRDAETVYDYFLTSLRDLKKEVFKVLFLDKGHSVITEETLFEGTLDQLTVYPREICKLALEKNASALVLVHNHPSGRLEPSGSDIATTKSIFKACNALSINLLDHLIIGRNHYFSFVQNHIEPFNGRENG